LGPDVFYTTIIRHPTDVFESLYAYADFQTVLKLSLHEYIKSLNRSESLHQHRINQYLGLNQQLFDLGQPLTDLYSKEAIHARIQKLDKEFDFIMLAERFEESMVLLADKLCWPLDNVKTFRINARKEAFKVHLSPEEIKILQHWQEGDMLLYEHFKAKFEEQVMAFGLQKMDEKIKILSELNQEAMRRCIIEESDRQHMNKTSLYRPFSPEVIGYNVKVDDHECRLLGMAENNLVELARTRQKSRWKKNNKG